MNAKCAICKKKDAAEAYLPFCSKRCADIDLGRWLNGSYAIPTEDSGSEEIGDIPKAAND